MEIIGIAGSAKAGKTTCTNFIVGQKMLSMGMIDGFELDDRGKLHVQAEEIQEDEAGTIKKVTREFNPKNNVRSPEFELWAQQDLWPHVKVYSLADPFKFFMMDTFGLTAEQCFGADKYTETNIAWERVQFLPGVKKKKGFLNAREAMEVVGSCFIRQVDEDTLINALLLKISQERPALALVDDVRADFEAAGLQGIGGKVIRLTRGEDKNISEQTIERIDEDFLLDNIDMTQEESTSALFETLKGWEYGV
jgi:hypothetical protein